MIELNQDIQHFLPESFQFPTKFDEPIQFLHLMNHTAGFDDSYTDLMLHDPSEFPSLKEALENLSGQDYRDYVNDHIFLSLGMTRTSIAPLQNDKGFTTSYLLDNQGQKIYFSEMGMLYLVYKLE